MREIQIYVVKDGQKSGPFTTEQIKLLLDRSEVSLSTLAWAEGHQKWEPLHIILGVRPPRVGGQNQRRPFRLRDQPQARLFLHLNPTADLHDSVQLRGLHQLLGL